METLNALYARHLELGFIVLRQAMDAKDWEWAEAERQLLHNIPSLINESNVERHKYFWTNERQFYMDWVSAAGPDPRSRMMTYYSPLWREMEPVMHELFSVAAVR